MRLFECLAGLMVLMPAAAFANNIDFGDMSAETTYEYSAFDTVSGKFTPTTSRKVKIEYTTSPLDLYSDAAHTEYVGGSHAYSDGKQVMSYELELGHTYYLYGWAMDSGNLIIHEGDIVLAVSSLHPDPALGNFSVSSNYRIEVTFNYPVTIGNVFLMTGDTREPITAMVTNTTVTCEVADVVMSWYRSGLLSENDEMTLRILQVKDAGDSSNSYGDTGRLDIPFTVCAKPAELVSIDNADLNGSSVIDSYYFPGDPRAEISFNFDTELSADIQPTANLSYGDVDNLEVGVYQEEIPGENSGKSAIFDMSGRLRRPIDMLPLSTPLTQPNSLHISFADIYSADGQRVYTGMLSNPTGYSVSFRINTLQYNVAADFTPPRGTALHSGKPLEIWVMNGSKIRFDAICFDYEVNGVPTQSLVYADAIEAVADEFCEDDMIFTLTVPDFEADAERGIDVSMLNMVCADGLDHSNDVFGDFLTSTSAISDIEADMTQGYDVYDAAGRQLLKGVTRGDVAKLPAGFYIINGKKIMIND